MDTKISEKRWVEAVTWFHLLGVFGAHRFYAGRIVSGIFYLFTLGIFGIGVVIDMLFLYTGNFRDADGALILMPSQMALLKRTRRPEVNTEREAKENVIRLNHIKPEDAANYIDCDHVALAIDGDPQRIAGISAAIIRRGNEVARFETSGLDIPPDALLRALGTRALMVGYDIRAKFPAVAELLKDVDASAEWDYIDLKEVAELRGVRYYCGSSAHDEAAEAESFFAGLRAC